MWSILATQILIGVVTALIIGFDIWLYNNGVPHDTISAVFKHWAILTPFIPYVWGVLAGHFFWGRVTPIIPNPSAPIVLGWSGIVMILIGIGLRYFAITVNPILFVVIGALMGHLFFPQ